jgi:hypothetical protein
MRDLERRAKGDERLEQSCPEVLATFATFQCCVQSVSLTLAHWGP